MKSLTTSVIVLSFSFLGSCANRQKDYDDFASANKKISTPTKPTANEFHWVDGKGCVNSELKPGYNLTSRSQLYPNDAEGVPVFINAIKDLECFTFVVSTDKNPIDFSFGRGFKNSNLRGAFLEETSWYGSAIENCDLTGATLKNAEGNPNYVLNSNFTRVDLTGAVLDLWTFQNVDLSTIRFDQTTSFRGAQFTADTKLPFSRKKAKELGMIEIEVPKK